MAKAVLDGLGYRARAGARRAWDRAFWTGRPILSAEAGNALIGRLVQSGQPTAVAKIGSTELQAVRHHLGRLGRGRPAGVWRDAAHLRRDLHFVSGVYPDEPETYSRFAQVYLEALSDLDVLAVWFKPGEAQLARRRAPRATAVQLRALESYFHASPWTRHLAGKQVLVISPFAASIEEQYARREQIWPHEPPVLPEMELVTLKMPLPAGIVRPQHPDWFAALDRFRDEMAAAAFDVALVGAGAWSLPLAVHAKLLGRIGVHLGGATQILFGLRGARWDDHPDFAAFFNDAWRRPSDEERPERYIDVERGSYW